MTAKTIIGIIVVAAVLAAIVILQIKTKKKR